MGGEDSGELEESRIACASWEEKGLEQSRKKTFEFVLMPIFSLLLHTLF